jgi:hypothetical protein
MFFNLHDDTVPPQCPWVVLYFPAFIIMSVPTVKAKLWNRIPFADPTLQSHYALYSHKKQIQLHSIDSNTPERET